MTGIVKRFGEVAALKEVDFSTRAGEVHAIVGENGAGKSTLMAVAAGDLRPDDGHVEIGGSMVETFTSASVTRMGLALVHQHPALLGDLSVTENFLLALPATVRPAFSVAKTWVQERLDQWESDIDPSARVSDLSLADQHLVELLKALATQPRVLILDEPTEHMDRDQVRRLFAGIRSLVRAQCTVVYISHRIHEVKEIANRITVIRDGAVRGVFEAAQVTEREIINLVVGRTLDAVFPPKLSRAAGASEDVVLEVRDYTGAGFNSVSLKVRKGEIVGVAGIEGNGQRDFLRALAGLSPSTGSSSLMDKDGGRQPQTAYVPRERHREGLMMQFGVGKNMTLKSLTRFALGGVVSSRQEKTAVRSGIESLAIKVGGGTSSVSTLSGGNQQKVVIARCLMDKPDVLLADEPSQGVDAGARFEIYSILRSEAAAGTAIVVASADARELAGLCDRVLIFSRGKVVKELVDSEVTERNITEAALTSTELRTKHATQAKSRAGSLLQSDFFPSAMLLAAAIVLGIFAAATSPFYFTTRNFSNLLALLAPLALLSVAQAVVMMVAGIDLSVGPLAGLVVVAASFFVLDGVSSGQIAQGLGISLLIAVGVGVLNWVLIRLTHITPVVATLATFMCLRGVSLSLRDAPDGLINSQVTDWLASKTGFVSNAFIAVLIIVVALEYALRRTRWGLSLRAAGSSEMNARRAGVRVELVQFGAYLLCALLSFGAGLMLMAQIGVGDPTAGVSYTLTSMTAVVLGGASLFGGRGSFVGALMGAALIQQSVNVTTFMKLDSAWQYWMIGALMLIPALLYSRLRRDA